MNPSSAPSHLDVGAFALAGRQLSGADSLAHYRRILEETEGRGKDRTLSWSAQGESRADALEKRQNWLHLEVHATLPLVCQRCLEIVDLPLQVDRWFRFVADEATAAAQDDDAEEDLLVSSGDFDLRELIEDELILEMPLIARHEVCPSGLGHISEPDAQDAPEPERQKPFAVLAQLRRPKDGDVR